MLQTGRSKGAKEKQTTLQWQLDVKTFKVAVVERRASSLYMEKSPKAT